MYTEKQIERLNKDIEQFPVVFPVTNDMGLTYEGVSRLVMLDRYAFKDTEKKTLREKDIVVLTIKNDPQFPARGIGIIKEIDWDNNEVTVFVFEEFIDALEDSAEIDTQLVTRKLDMIDKPLELYYEQINKRNAKGLSDIENDDKKEEVYNEFYEELKSENFVPAGRVIYGAGSGQNVTYFNCFVMPYPQDSREGIAKHRTEVMEIMSRGGGVGTNGSTLRPRNSLARGVNGKSSGSVSWLDDIAKLTHLVEQGGSRRGAQMIMLADWHPDIIQFIISKMQNPRILRFIIENTKDKEIKQLAKEKLKFTPFTDDQKKLYKLSISNPNISPEDKRKFENKLETGGEYSVHNKEFLSGANISITLTKEFMAAIENDLDYELKFPDVENYTKEQMEYYNQHWQDCGDVREWESVHEMPVKVYRTIKAKELWSLVSICATYSAEPGIFFIDNSNDETNAKAYGQKVVATNPCGKVA